MYKNKRPGRAVCMLAAALLGYASITTHAQTTTKAVDNSKAPVIRVDLDADFLKYPVNFGEVLGVAVNSKGHIVVLNHPGSSTTGPLYGNATTQLLEFDSDGTFLHEVGQAVYGLGYGHSVRFDRSDNLWVVDKGTMSVMKFNPQGRIVMNLGRRPEGPDEVRRIPPESAVAVDGLFNGPTDVGWDAQDNIYISDGYVNSRIAKFTSNGDWIKSWGSYGTAANQFKTPHNLQVDRQGNVYVADRGNNRINVYDSEGNWKRDILLNAPYDKSRHPVIGNLKPPVPDNSAPWALCLTTYGPTQYLYASDNEPGRVYKLSLDGKILGMFGESGHGPKQFNWIHGIACPTENVLFIADMNNWRVVKATLHPAGADH